METTKARLAGWIFLAVVLGMVAGGLLLYEVLVSKGVLPTNSNPKDTPIVIAGGSIYAEAAPTDPIGWTSMKPQKSYNASHHATSGNPRGIDQIALTGFDQNPANAISGTGGWAITYWDKDEQGNPKPNAAQICSDSSCSASASPLNGSRKDSACNPASLNLNGPIYITAGASAQWEQIPQGSKIGMLHFIDTSCDESTSSTKSSCDKISQISLETCLPRYQQAYYTCKGAQGHCTVTIGQ